MRARLCAGRTGRLHLLLTPAGLSPARSRGATLSLRAAFVPVPPRPPLGKTGSSECGTDPHFHAPPFGRTGSSITVPPRVLSPPPNHRLHQRGTPATAQCLFSIREAFAARQAFTWTTRKRKMSRKADTPPTVRNSPETSKPPSPHESKRPPAPPTGLRSRHCETYSTCLTARAGS